MSTVTTKAGSGLKDIPVSPPTAPCDCLLTSAHATQSSFNESLKKLGLDYVDLYLIHYPYDFRKPDYPTIQEAWKQMEAIKDSGRAKSIGVSNSRVRDLEKIYSIPDLKHPPTVNQVRRISSVPFGLY